MALVQNYRKPDVFLIMTINPKWDEITCELEPGQTPQDHPDLVVYGKCRNNYLREFNATTSQGKDSYPLYRRRNDGKCKGVRGHPLDNRWDVPYNPYLLWMYNSHMNVETRISVMFLIRKTQAGRCLQCIARLTGSMSGLEISFIEISQCGLLGRRQLNEGVL
uniref:Helitron helicase-like domain-containing protein n=1 Tax=Oryza sativa subsp. japonica TaxID=39947 RepID=Q2QS57_ORYSJ|nr:hypothetical protein LOC_Os12g25260 [Oryza sativa Japonica Group]